MKLTEQQPNQLSFQAQVVWGLKLMDSHNITYFTHIIHSVQRSCNNL